jgi:hypothetical protein
LRDRLDGDEARFEADVPAAVLALREADQRRAADQRVFVDPVERAAHHLLVALGQVAGGQQRFPAAFVSLRLKPRAQVAGLSEPIGDLGHDAAASDRGV